MIIGEALKLFRNRVFIVVAFVILFMDALTIIYSLGTKDEGYVYYRNIQQSQYIETYQMFIEDMDERGETLLKTFGNDENKYYSRNIEKMISDYEKLGNVEIDSTYNWAMEKYADFTYGIFFVVVFSFACVECLYVYERRCGMINMLRVTNNGRCGVFLAKFLVCIFCVALFALLQELLFLMFDFGIYSAGNLEGSIQSLQIFRDCSYRLSIFEAYMCAMVMHVFLAIIIGCFIFFCTTAFVNRLTEIMVPILFFVLEYATKNMSINLFYAWDIKNLFGVYHNINLFGFPIDKNLVVVVVGIVLCILLLLVGRMVFSVRYISEMRNVLEPITNVIHSVTSKLLHFQNLYVNELYKLLIMQKKWLLIVCFGIIVAIVSKDYLPKDTYQTAFEATYHMYLSNVHGEIDDETKAYIEDERQYISNVEAQIDASMESGDSYGVEQVSDEIESRKKAFERLESQYELVSDSQKDGYLIDELDFKALIENYVDDILIFVMSGIVLVLCLSGLFASKEENSCKLLVDSMRNGRGKLFNVKLVCGAGLLLIVFAISVVPSLVGYANVFEFDEMRHKLSLLYEPQIALGISIFAFMLIVGAVRLLVSAAVFVLTTLMAMKTHSEFVVSTFICTVLVVIALILYFSKMNINSIMINLSFFIK